MAIDMYQKREEIAKKKLKNNNEKEFSKAQINWDHRPFCKSLLYDFNILREMINNV